MRYANMLSSVTPLLSAGYDVPNMGRSVSIHR
jgi:hypothetical protein